MGSPTAHPEFERERERRRHISMEEADRRMESAGEIPFSKQEIEAMVRRATTDPTPPPGIRVTSRRAVWNKVAAVLIAAAILLGCLLLMSVGRIGTLASGAVT